jgi:hypothetical protein
MVQIGHYTTGVLRNEVDGEFICLVKKHFEHKNNFDIHEYINAKLKNQNIFVDIGEILPGSELIAEQDETLILSNCNNCMADMRRLYKYADKILMCRPQGDGTHINVDSIEHNYKNKFNFLNKSILVFNKNEFNIYQSKLPCIYNNGYYCFLNKNSRLRTIMDVFKGLYGQDGKRMAIEFIDMQYEFNC